MLIELAVKSSIVLAAALVAVVVMRGRSAATRHVVLASAFVATLALPLVVVGGPRLQLSSLSTFATTRPSSSNQFDVGRTHGRASPLQPVNNQGNAPNVFSHWRADDWVRLLTLIWLIGIVINTIKLCAGIASAVRLVHDAQPLTDSHWTDSLTSIANSMRLAHHVALRTSAHVSVPLAWRLGRKCSLILPLEADRWHADTRRAVLLHECGHLDRHDCAIRSLGVLACGLWWFNPLAYLALRRLRAEQERACDDLVLAAGIAPLDYANELLDMARRSATANLRGAACVAMVGRSELEDRMFAIVDRSRRRGGLAPRTRLLAITVSVGMVVAVGALRLSAARTESSTAGVMALHVMGPGGPAFKWMRDIDEPTRRRVASALDAAGRDSDAQVRSVAERALQTIREMPEGTVTISGQCRGNCLVGASSALPSLAEAIFETETKTALAELETRTAAARRHAVPRLWSHSELGAETLAELLRDPDPQVRALAAIRLDSVIFPRAVPGWIDLLADENDSLRERAAISLGAIGDPAAVDALASALLNDRNADVRRQAARSLGMIATGS